ncbi:MAG: AAA family ATPase, partial [Thiomargarita sp.]|nr:AAA family ATPase [Thiomargarita sp.]
LLKLLPSITHIEIKDKTHVVYIEQDENQQVYKAIPFEKLASGYKSIIAIIGDLLIRFFKEQNVDNPDDLTGIVLIDELDLHLHPKWLRKLPILLSSIFPKIQFIVSTHSVIPFLGAPQHSVFLKVTRTQETGIQLEKLHIDIKNLLPNSILTSPIFDLEGEDIRRDL